MRNKSDLYINASVMASVSKKLAMLVILGCITAVPAVVNAQTINTKTTVTDSGGTRTKTGKDSVQNISGATLNKNVKTEEVKAKKEAAAKAAAKREEETKDVNYTGLYNGRQVVPDIMAIYCKTNAEQFLADTSLIDKCLNKYLAAMNSSNATLRSDGVKDYNALLLRLALDAYATALTKTASVANYEDVQNEMADKSRKSQNEREDGASISNTTSVTTDVINSLRELYASSIFLEAVQGMEAVDPSVLDQEVVNAVEETADQAARHVSDTSAAFSVSTEASMETPIDTGEKIEDAKASPDEIAEAEARASAEAAAKAEEPTVDGGTLEEVKVIGKSPLNNLENMSPEEFAQNKDKVEAIRANMTKQMNAPDAEDWEIADAQRSLERLSAIEKKQKEALAAQEAAEAADAAGSFVGNGQCTAGGKTVACADGKHTDQYGKEWSCEGGICVMQSLIDAEEKFNKKQENLEKAKTLLPKQLKKAIVAYRGIINDPKSTDAMKAEAQEYLEILNEAAPSILSNMPCAQAKREYGLSISCSDWNK